jgi:hypothetical protein
MAHAQGALVGYVHPFDSPPDPEHDAALTDELPADVALGKVDYIEVLGFSDHKSTADVWYKLLNCGFHLPAAAGTDFMGNFASLRGPAGLNRVYAQVPSGPLRIEPWLAAIKSGRTFATNGPLLSFTLDDQPIGSELKLTKPEVRFTAEMASIVPIDHLQVICNGKVARELPVDPGRMHAKGEDTITLDSSGWCVLRAFSDKAEFPILDAYPYATTSPIYVTVAGAPLRSPADAAFFATWMDRLIAAASGSTSWNTAAEKKAVLDLFEQAKAKFQSQR